MVFDKATHNSNSKSTLANAIIARNETFFLSVSLIV